MRVYRELFKKVIHHQPVGYDESLFNFHAIYFGFKI